MHVTRLVRSQWDRAGAVLAAVLGLIVIALGYAGVSSTRDATEQIPYLVSGGILGLFFLGIAHGLWISADLRDEWRRLHELDDDTR
jgi:multisubunit Na+/H+ antiporter MnhB subunit